MARRAGHDVEESERLVVLVNLVAGQFATQNSGKYVVWIVARHRDRQACCAQSWLKTGPSDGDRRLTPVRPNPCGMASPPQALRRRFGHKGVRARDSRRPPVASQGWQ